MDAKRKGDPFLPLNSMYEVQLVQSRLIFGTAKRADG